MVLRRVILWAAVVSVAAFLSPRGLEGSSRPHPIVARVRFLATSTSVRGVYSARNQDVYLADMTSRDYDGLVRIVDDYPQYRPPISAAILTSREGTKLHLLRDRSCDVAYAEMPLRTAPGDPTATLPVKLTYRPTLPEAVQPEEILPCYRIVRR